MPELPDVEAFRQVLASCGQGERIERVEVYDTGVLHGVSARGLRDALEGRRFAEPARHGKWLLARTEGGPTLLMHFGMTGGLVCRRAPASRRQDGNGDRNGNGDGEQEGGDGEREGGGGAYDRVVFALPGGRQLRYRDQRKLKGLWLADDAETARVLGRLGPDAAASTRQEFDAALSGRRGGVKSALTDQSLLAGLGNLLADEILWRARIHPSRRAADLDAGDRALLHSAMLRTLRTAIRAGRVPDRRDWLTGHRGAADDACPRCGTRLRHGRVAGRGTVWCPHCQGGGPGKGEGVTWHGSPGASRAAGTSPRPR